ncbi:MAG: FAD-dependent oxidoreductase [Lachnospiraceae bacterium]|nr:FAD-dependent oxidoreductase [Lachnospiraceae bacterium]
MIRIQIKLKPGHAEKELYEKAAKLLRVPEKEIKHITIHKKSLDARKKPSLFYLYTLDIEAADEEKLIKRSAGAAIAVHPTCYRFPDIRGEQPLMHPVVVGTGPAGLFCGLFLARAGYAPILLERGKAVEERRKDVERYWEGGPLCPQSNVQFGEGGAGTFSDGKLNTLVKDKYGRNTEVLRLLVEFGAPPEILYESKPHIGTDILRKVVKNLREEICRLGGEVLFESKLTELITESGRISGVVINGERQLSTKAVILAIGHSARDTFSMLYEKGIPMEAKPFAVGFRVEHRQKVINTGQYGADYPKILPAASYKVTAKTHDGRGVYSFCMCPGGYVVNASSEEGRLCVNGMSYSGRKGENANSAIIVAVSPDDFESTHPLAGIAFQRGLEERAYLAGAGKVPVQTYGSFKENVEQSKNSSDAAKGASFAPAIKGEYTYADLTHILPMHLNQGIIEGMEQFAEAIHGFNDPDTLLSAVEARTSSPVRILRNETLQSTIEGLFPCGEGAGYAGGITSAAMDGIKVAEAVAASYKPVS